MEQFLHRLCVKKQKTHVNIVAFMTTMTYVYTHWGYGLKGRGKDLTFNEDLICAKHCEDHYVLILKGKK